jgi:hypothetical protein
MLSTQRHRLVTNRLTMRTCSLVTPALALADRMAGISARFVGGM